MDLQASDPPNGPESTLRLVIEAAPNAMVMVSERGRIVLVNSEAERSFGYTRDELLQMRIEDLMPARARGSHKGFRAAYFRAPDRRGMGLGRELFGLRKDGTELPIEIGLNPIVIGGENFVVASIIDITERLRAQAVESAAREDALRRSILDTIPFSIIATDLDGRIVTANPAAEALLGYAQEDLIGSWLTEIDGDQREVRPDGSPVLARQQTTEDERTYRRKNGTLVPVSEAVVALTDDDGASAGFLAVAYDVTKRLEDRQQVQHMITHDALTDLPNRTRLMEHLEEAIEAAGEDGSQVALLLVDLDHFRRVNDSLGHDVGDELLMRLSERLRGWVRGGDLVARLGGDEFAVVFRDVLPFVDLTSRTEELLGSILAPVEVKDYELVLTASIGAASYPRDGDSATTLLRHADTALYRAKASGRDTVQWFQAAMLDETNDKLALSAALRQAIGHGELSVVYQPQVDLATGMVVGVEALARWSSPEHGSVSPDRFIPVAEDSGMIQQIGDWVLRRACADVALLQEALGRPMRLSVNVSPRQLRGRSWVDQVANALADAGLRPDQLEVEVTEGLLIEDRAEAVDLLSAVRDLGVRVVVDDFGKGYSSLAYLNRFPVDRLKIDRSFIQSISGVGSEAAIVDAIIVMAHALGMSVVAEGVETECQETYLRARGCDEAQGYRYSPGVPIGEVVTAAGVIGDGRPVTQ